MINPPPLINNKTDIEIIHNDIFNNFLKFLPIDIGCFLILSFVVTSFINGLKPSHGAYLFDLLYFCLLIISYVLFFIYIRPIINRILFSDWFYFKETSKDSALVKLNSLKRRIIFLKWSPKTRIRMVMGELNSILWNSRYFVDTITQLINKDINIEIVIKNYCDVESREIFRLAVEDKLKIYFANEKLVNECSNGHFMVTDRKGVWLSDPHPRFIIDKEGRYSFGPSSLAHEKEKIFEYLCIHGTLLDINTIHNLNFVSHDCEGKDRPASELEVQNLLDYIATCAKPLNQSLSAPI